MWWNQCSPVSSLSLIYTTQFELLVLKHSFLHFSALYVCSLYNVAAIHTYLLTLCPPQKMRFCPSAQWVSVASGCSSKCPQLQFRPSELSVFQCFDGFPGSGHSSAPLSLHLQLEVGGMTHTETHSPSSAPGIFFCPSQNKTHTFGTQSFQCPRSKWMICLKNVSTTVSSSNYIQRMWLNTPGGRVHSLPQEPIYHNTSAYHL